MAESIPVLSLDACRAPAGTARDRADRILGEALVEFGFLTVEGHGIDQALIRRVYEHFERFFALPLETKMRYGGVAGGARGFTPFGVEHAKDHPVPDLKEFWHVGQELPEGHPYLAEYGRNLWPKEIEGLREATLELFLRLESVAADLLAALARYFDLPERTFAAMMHDGNSVLRILHYPPVPSGADERSYRAAPHEDINLITLLCEATDSGLEILTRDGHWLPVSAHEGQIVVDSGDMLSRVTNGVVPATTHRVVASGEARSRARYSMPFFVHPFSACDLTVLPMFVDEERPAQWPPITAGAYLDQRLREIGLKPRV